ncbi:MAG: gfo/Idh/MocA family oxidoreductase, partial [Neisseria sp.]|nr:gfo/Idh/MocA family oxidoreductase [Neisseria sp.]
CATAAQALQLAELAERQGVLLTVYQNRRWDSAPLTAKKLLSDDLLGEIVDAEFRFERYAAALNKKRWKETGEAGVGLVYDLGSHLMDMAVDIFGMPDELYADVRYQHERALSDDNFYIALYENLYDALQGKSPTAVQPRQVAQVLGLLEKVYESAKSGCRVKV